MIVIADSSSTRTAWVIADNDTEEFSAQTDELDPITKSRREISHIIRLQLPQEFFKRRWDHVYFYGIGCESPEIKSVIESSLTTQFRTRVSVGCPQLAAARSLLQDKPGVACILGQRAGCCRYDGREVTSIVRPLGYLLGEEGSGMYMGKMFVGDCLKGFAPQRLKQLFYEEYSLTDDKVLEEVYSPAAARVLAGYETFLRQHKDDEYVRALARDGFEQFLRTTLSRLGEVDSASFVGSVAVAYKDILTEVMNAHGIRVDIIEAASMPGLLRYHADHR